MRVFSGNTNFRSKKVKIAIVMSNFNKQVSQRLLEGALRGFKDNAKLAEIDIYNVPGAFEIPAVVDKLIFCNNNYDGIVTLGSIIKGETDHYKIVANEVGRQISNLTVNTHKPIVFGVLTVNNLEQALARSRTETAFIKTNNKGYYCAIAILEMIDLKLQILKE